MRDRNSAVADGHHRSSEPEPKPKHQPQHDRTRNPSPSPSRRPSQNRAVTDGCPRRGWPFSLTVCTGRELKHRRAPTPGTGIHERQGRQHLREAKVAHVMNDETQRKYLQSVKRLMTFSQSALPPDGPSKAVLMG